MKRKIVAITIKSKVVPTLFTSEC